MAGSRADRLPGRDRVRCDICFIFKSDKADHLEASLNISARSHQQPLWVLLSWPKQA
jgi:hypothetical protein